MEVAELGGREEEKRMLAREEEKRLVKEAEDKLHE